MASLQGPGVAMGRCAAGQPPSRRATAPRGTSVAARRTSEAGRGPAQCEALASPSEAFGESLASSAPGRDQHSVLDRHEYRRGVGVCVVNRHGLVFAAKRRDDRQGTWQMPQGGIDPYENPREAALRELKEETGITNARIVASIDEWLHYDFPTKVRAQFSGQWLRYRGQTQKWFLLEFNGEEAEIDLTRHGEPEFEDWTWAELERLPHEVVDFKRPVYEQVARHFAHHIRLRLAQQLHRS